MNNIFIQNNGGITAVPIELSKLVLKSWNADIAIIDDPNNLYIKAIHGQGEVTFINGNQYTG